MRQNLVFALEAADENGPFQYRLPDNTSPVLPAWVFSFNLRLCQLPLPLDFGCSAYNYSVVDEFKPFEDNYFLRNFAYSPDTVNPDGSLASGVYYRSQCLPSNCGPRPTPILVPGIRLRDSGQSLSFPRCSLPPTRNGYILPTSRVTPTGRTLASPTFSPTSSSGPAKAISSACRINRPRGCTPTEACCTPALWPAVAASRRLRTIRRYFYAQVAPPQLQTIGYFFGVPNRDYLPGNAGFSPHDHHPAHHHRRRPAV